MYGIVFQIARESAYQEGVDFGEHVVMGSASCPSVLWLDSDELELDVEFDFGNRNRSNWRAVTVFIRLIDNMTRGRKKDQTIPSSRALTLQRDYRARKAQYVANLEKRCQAAEEENHRLRQEIEQAHAVKLSNAYEWSPQTVSVFHLF